LIKKWLNKLASLSHRKFRWRWINRNIYNTSPSITGKRALQYSHFFKSMGTSCFIKSGCIIQHTDKISLGNGVSIQYNCLLNGYGSIQIGNDVSLGSNTKIFSSEHPYNTEPFKYNKLIQKPVIIGDNVITGADTIILGGIQIGDNVMIGAGSVVTKNIPSNSVYAGNPARCIKVLGTNGAE